MYSRFLISRLRQLSDTKVSKFGRDVLVSDLAPPSKIVDNFCDLYAREWSIAFEGLKTSLRDEETALVTLFRIIRVIFSLTFPVTFSEQFCFTRRLFIQGVQSTHLKL